MNKKVKYLGENSSHAECMSCGYDIRFFSTQCGGQHYAKRKELKCPKCRFVMPI